MKTIKKLTLLAAIAFIAATSVDAGKIGPKQSPDGSAWTNPVIDGKVGPKQTPGGDWIVWLFSFLTPFK